jgi:hypothetical protein
MGAGFSSWYMEMDTTTGFVPSDAAEGGTESTLFLLEGQPANTLLLVGKEFNFKHPAFSWRGLDPWSSSPKSLTDG